MESLLTLQAENLGELLDPAPENHSEELSQMLAERVKRLEKVFVCDAKPATFKLLRSLVPKLPQENPPNFYSRTPKEVEDGVPDLKGRTLKLSPPPDPVAGEVTRSPELASGSGFAISTGEPDPLFGYIDARVALGLAALGGVRRAAYAARGGDEPRFYEETPARSTVLGLIESATGITFGTIVTRGGEPFSVIDGGAEQAKAHLTASQPSPTKGLVVGAGGVGFDDTLSHMLRLALVAVKGVRKGGEVLLIGEARDGVGSDALRMHAMGRLSEGALKRGYYADGLEEIAYLDSLRDNYSVTLLSSLPELYAGGRFRFRTAKNAADAIQKVLGSTGRNAKINVFTRAPETLIG